MESHTISGYKNSLQRLAHTYSITCIGSSPGQHCRSLQAPRRAPLYDNPPNYPFELFFFFEHWPLPPQTSSRVHSTPGIKSSYQAINRTSSFGTLVPFCDRSSQGPVINYRHRHLRSSLRPSRRIFPPSRCETTPKVFLARTRKPSLPRETFSPSPCNR